MKTKLFYFFSALGLILGIFISLHNVFSGSVAFWYDPARDILSAWDNLSKLTLIGPTSGIPGIFYGPYWIWWLSFAELISKDPKIVILITTTVPYILFYTLLMYLFSKIIGKLPAILLWILYFYNFQGQITSLWNPNLAPLLFLAIFYLLVTFVSRKNTGTKIVQIFCAGILSGLALNIHISFSTGFIIGSLLYLFIFVCLSKKKSIDEKIRELSFQIVSFLIGIAIMFVPFFLFEMRHGFMQTKTLIAALEKGGGVVAIQGLTKVEILQNFVGKFTTLLQIPSLIGSIVFIALAVLFVILLLMKKIKLTDLEIHLISLLCLVTFVIMTVYLTAKNPIWPYHFIGAEIIFSLFIGLVIAKIKPLKYVLVLWICVLSIFQLQGLINSLHSNPLEISSLYTKEIITNTVVHDAGDKEYTFYAYNPAIYMYDYAYLFRWLGKKSESFDPGQVQRVGTIYLILSPGKKSALDDFVHFRSPVDMYTTTKSWHFPDGTVVVKRSPLTHS